MYNIDIRHFYLDTYIRYMCILLILIIYTYTLILTNIFLHKYDICVYKLKNLCFTVLFAFTPRVRPGDASAFRAGISREKARAQFGLRQISKLAIQATSVACFPSSK